jgi:head-tail adaptor
MPYGSVSNLHIGDLRYVVTLANRVQTPDAATGITETYINRVQTYASISPLGLMTFIGSEQIDTPITHRIVFRWIDSLDLFDVVLRQVSRLDGTLRQEIYRVRRITDWEGRQRFTVIDAELERRDG